MQIFAILGSHPELSVAELEAVTGQKASTKAVEAAVFDDFIGDINDLNRRLGGTQKLGMIVGTLATPDVDQAVEFLSAELLKRAKDEGKINFGFSMYMMGGPNQGSWKNALKPIGLTLKKKLKEGGRSARLVVSREPTLSTVVVAKNHMIEKGAEFVILVGKTETLVGVTLAVQDFEDWGERDFGRPARNAKQGMLPPKLARMMVNLAEGSEESEGSKGSEAKVLLDPFCGSGTVLMEAAMVGYEKLIGSDIAAQAVRDTKENLEWLSANLERPVKPEVFESPAAKLPSILNNRLVDVIVTEPYLGKPRTGRERSSDVIKGIDELTELYIESFTALASILKPGGVMVVAFPIHFIGEDKFEMPIDKIIAAAGLRRVDVGSLYRHEGQYVGRQIVRLTLARP